MSQSIPSSAGSLGVFQQWVGRVGFLLHLLMIALIPLFFIPPRVFVHFFLEEGILAGKNLAIIFLSAAILVVTAVSLLGTAWRNYRGLALAGSAALLLFLSFALISVMLSPVPYYSLQTWLPQGLALASAATGPLFLSSTRRVRCMIVAGLAAGALVSLIGLLSVAGVRTFNTFIYGIDQRDVMNDPELRAMIVGLAGGVRSSLVNSTIGNPEYAGTYAAILAAIAAVVLLDWIPGRRPRWGWRLAGLCLVSIFLLTVLFSERRQPFVAISLAALVRLLFFLGVSRRWAAGAFVATLFVALLLDLRMAAALAVILLVLMAVSSLRLGAMTRIRTADRFNLLLLLGAPALMLLALIAFSTPGPWNPKGLRLLQRFSSLLSYSDNSYRERATMYLIASGMAWDDPLFGVGPGRYFNQFTIQLADLVEEDDSGVAALARERLGNMLGDKSHNDYLQIAAEQGVPALLCFLTALITILMGLSRIIEGADPWPRLCALALVVGLVAFFSTMFTSFPLHVPSRLALFSGLVASSLGLISENESRRAP